jgi:type VI secretion system secreted protein Hcp
MMKRVVVTLALAAGLLAAKPASASGTLYLKIPGITGEVTTKGFEGQIEVFSFSMGATAPDVAARRNRGVEVCSDLAVMKRADITSPILFQHTVFGYFYKTVTLSFVLTAGGTAMTVFQLVLNNVAIQSVQESGSAGGDDRPTESVSFKPSSWTLTAWPTLQDGRVGSPVTTTVTCQ